MLFSNWFAIAINILTAIVSTAILLLLLSQLRRDTKSLSLALLCLPLAMIGFFDIVLRFMAFSGENPVEVIFMILTVLTTFLPVALFTFTIDYFSIWTQRRRWIQRMLVTVVAIAVILCTAQIVLHYPFVFKGIQISPEGLMVYEYG